MNKLTGWQRLLMVISVVWVAGVLFRAGYDYQAVADGGDATLLVCLQDAKTGRSFCRLSRDEIRELGELTLQRSRSSEAQPTDAKEAKLILEAEPRPLLRYRVIALLAVLPATILWVLYACLLWVTAGFRRSA